MDEISWMAQFSLTFPEILKNAWDDLFKKHANLVLVLCGSVSSWIRDEIVENRGDGVLEFETLGGHAYEVEETDSLTSGTWTKRAFSLDGGSTEVDVISEPSAPPYMFRRTVYLKPKETDGSRRFYRVKAR